MRGFVRLALGGRLIGSAAAGLLVLGASALAQTGVDDFAADTAVADPIGSIRVEGTQRIDPETVQSYLTVRPGDAFDRGALNASLKSLFDTGLFGDVTLRREGSVLVVSVVENPIINRIAFEGNQEIDDDTLMNEVQLRPRVVYTRTRVQSDVARLLEVYRRSGRFSTTIEPKIIQLDQNRVDLVYEISEGPETGVQRISFVGNRAFGDGRLRSEIETRETRFWRILSDTDSYDPDRLAADREELRRFYLSEGYADFRIVSAVAELTPDQEDFFITFTVEEGERYRFGSVDVESRLPDLDASQLVPLVTSTTGDWYSSEEVDRSIDALTDALADRQYAFVDIRPQVTRNREQRTVDVVYQINEGPRVFVERIDITGNLRTVDQVIRREMELVEGDPFNASELRRSEQRVRNLGFFENVQVTTAPGSAPDRVVITVAVEEAPTGELSIGAGYSTTDGPLGDISIREKNLLGRGQDLRASATLSGSTQEFDISFTEPYFLGRDLSAGIDLFHIIRNDIDTRNFDETTTGFALRLGYPLGENLRQTLRYRLAERDISDVDDDASRLIREQEGRTLTSSVSQQLVYDRLDSRLNPTDGFILRFGNEIAGLGGDVYYLRTTASAGYYTPVLEDVILALTGEAGLIFGLGEDVRINDRFFVGGSNLRGFETAGIGPRDLDTDDALGGNEYAVASAEVGFPIGLPEELGITGRTFTDVGYLANVDGGGDDIEDERALRASVGVGLSWSSPLGPIRVDLAVPVVKQDYDEEELFRFSFGTRF